jgi:hypothetical protein
MMMKTKNKMKMKKKKMIKGLERSNQNLLRILEGLLKLEMELCLQREMPLTL